MLEAVAPACVDSRTSVARPARTRGEREDDCLAPVTEWTVIVETPPRAVTAKDEIDAFRRALSANPAARHPAASFDPVAGTFVAQFQVVAETSEAAALRGCFANWGSIVAAGVAFDAESSVFVAPPGDAGHADRFSVVARVDRQ